MNPGPRTCEARALPLSYTPSPKISLWRFTKEYLPWAPLPPTAVYYSSTGCWSKIYDGFEIEDPREL